MGDKTGIEWTESSWNPIVGCSIASPGCHHCYAAREAAGRLRNVPTYAGLAVRGTNGHAQFTGEIRCLPERLSQPYRWRRPRRIFVNSMSDLFHPDVPDGFIVRVLDVMYRCPEHTFQVLTKRPQRMAAFLRQWADRAGEPDGMPPMPRGPDAFRSVYTSGRAGLFAAMLDDMGDPPAGCAYPLYDWMEGPRFWPVSPCNGWWGTSVEADQYTFRVHHLRDTPAAVRFVSAEPLLGPLPSLDLTGIDWVIIGAESGPGARPMHPDWVRAIIEKARMAGTAVFVKQLTGRAGRPAKDIGLFPPDLRIREYPKGPR